jgi:hypothetical protein
VIEPFKIDEGKGWKVEWFDVEQRSAEWFALRCGTLTASNFAAMRRDADSKTRTILMRRIAAEIISGLPMETYANGAMDRGNRQEPAILDGYAFRRGVDVQRVGFVRRTICNRLGEDLVIGCSPDGVVGEEGLVQAKSMQPDLLVAMIDNEAFFPTEHVPQAQGELWVTGLRWCDVEIGYEGCPLRKSFRNERNEQYIGELQDAAESFMHDLRKLVARVKAKGRIR